MSVASSSPPGVENVGVVWHLCQPFLEIRDFVQLACANKVLRVICKHVSVDLSRGDSFPKYLSLQTLIDLREAWPKFHRLEIVDHHDLSASFEEEEKEGSSLLWPIVTTFETDLTDETPSFEAQTLARNVSLNMTNLTRLSLVASDKISLGKVYLFLKEFSVGRMNKSKLLPLASHLSSRSSSRRSSSRLSLAFIPPPPPPKVALTELELCLENDLPPLFKFASRSSSSSLAYFQTRVTFLKIAFQDYRLASPTVASDLTRFISNVFDSLTTLELEGATLWNFLPSLPLPATLTKLKIVDLANHNVFEKTDRILQLLEIEVKEEQEFFFPWALPLLEEFSLSVPDREIDPCWQRSLAIKLPLLSRLTLTLNIGKKNNPNYFRVLCREEMERLTCLNELKVTNTCATTEKEEENNDNFKPSSRSVIIDFGGFRSTSLKRLILLSEADSFFRVTKLNVPCLVEYEGPFTNCFFYCCSAPDELATSSSSSLEKLHFDFSEECVLTFPLPVALALQFPPPPPFSAGYSSASEIEKFLQTDFLANPLQTNRLRTLGMKLPYDDALCTCRMANFVLAKCTQNQPLLTHVTLTNYVFTNDSREDADTVFFNPVNALKSASIETLELLRPHRTHTVTLSPLENLRTLHISNCGSFSKFSGDGDGCGSGSGCFFFPSNLTSLSLDTLPRLESLAVLGKKGGVQPLLPHLSSLSITNCKNVKSLEGLPYSVRYLKWYSVPIATFSLECFLSSSATKAKNQQQQQEEEEKKKEVSLMLPPHKEKEQEQEKKTWNFASVDVHINARQHRDKTKEIQIQPILRQCDQFRLLYPQTAFTLSFLK